MIPAEDPGEVARFLIPGQLGDGFHRVLSLLEESVRFLHPDLREVFDERGAEVALEESAEVLGVERHLLGEILAGERKTHVGMQVAVDVFERPLVAIEPVDEDRFARAVDEIHQKGLLLHHRIGRYRTTGKEGDALVDLVGDDGEIFRKRVRLVSLGVVDQSVGEGACLSGVALQGFRKDERRDGVKLLSALADHQGGVVAEEGKPLLISGAVGDRSGQDRLGDLLQILEDQAGSDGQVASLEERLDLLDLFRRLGREEKDGRPIDRRKV